MNNKEEFYLDVQYIVHYEEICFRILKNTVTEKFNIFEFGLCGSPWYGNEYTCDNFYEAFEYFVKYQRFPFYKFKIKYLDPKFKFHYVKKLVEKLNKDGTYFIEYVPIQNFKEHLGVEFRIIEDAKEKEIKEINITKNNQKYFFVGKISIDNSSIIVKNEFDEIVFLTSNDNLTLNTQSINKKPYWYFVK